MRRWAVLAALGWLGLAGAARAEVVVFGPGSMTEALEQVAAAAGQAGLAVKVVGGHSPAQARQIADGAPADIFVSADPAWMDFLDQKGLLVEASRTSLASTQLVLLAAAGSTMHYDARRGESLAAVLGEGRLAIADPDSVPAGRFARIALEKLDAWDAVAGRLALLPNVRAVVAMIERGEVPAGIGFANDVSPERHVRIVAAFPPEVAAPVSYPMAIIAGRDGAEIRKVYDFMRGPQGLAVLRRQGFSDPVPGR